MTLVGVVLGVALAAQPSLSLAFSPDAYRAEALRPTLAAIGAIEPAAQRALAAHGVTIVVQRDSFDVEPAHVISCQDRASPECAQWRKRYGGDRGLYLPGSRIIYATPKRDLAATLHHEVFHALSHTCGEGLYETYAVGIRADIARWRLAGACVPPQLPVPVLFTDTLAPSLRYPLSHPEDLCAWRYACRLGGADPLCSCVPESPSCDGLTRALFDRLRAEHGEAP